MKKSTIVKAIDYYEAQGYYYSKALPFGEFLSYMRVHSWWIGNGIIVKAWIFCTLLCALIFSPLLAWALPTNNSTKPLQASSTKIGLSVQPITRESILEQAGSTDNVVSISSNKLVFGTKKSYVYLAGQISAIGFQAADGRFNRTYLGTNSISNNRFTMGSTVSCFYINSDGFSFRNIVLSTHFMCAWGPNAGKVLE